MCGASITMLRGELIALSAYVRKGRVSNNNQQLPF